MRIMAGIANDVRFQVRHGFYYAYALVCLLYILFLRSLPEDVQGMAGTVLLFSDPGALGSFFVGGIVLLERGQSILDTLFVTPLRLAEYLISKVVSLTVLAISTAFAIVLLTFGWRFDPLLLLAGIVLSSAFFTLLGLGIVVRVKTLNGYLLVSPFYVTVFFLPALEHLQVYSSPLFYLLPGKATMMLIDGAFHGIGGGELVYALGTMGVWILLAYLWAHRSFTRYVIMRIGGGGA